MKRSLSQSEMNTLLDITFLFHSVRDVTLMSQRFLQMLGKIVPFESAVVFLNEEYRRPLFPCAQIRCDPTMLREYTEQFQNLDYLGWRIYQTERKVVRESDQIRAGERRETRFYREFLHRHDIEHRMLLSAHSSAGELLALVMLLRSRILSDFSDREMFILELLQNHFSIGVENALQFREMQLRESRTREVYRSVSDAILVLDDRLEIRESNEAAQAYLEQLGPEKTEEVLRAVRVCCGALRDGNASDAREVSVEGGTARVNMMMGSDLQGTPHFEFIVTVSRGQEGRADEEPRAAEEPYRSRFFETLSENYGLTRREVTLIRYALDGYENQQIAADLYISLFTVKTHFQNAYSKLDVKNRQELYLIYMRYIISEQFRQEFDAQRRKEGEP